MDVIKRNTIESKLDSMFSTPWHKIIHGLGIGFGSVKYDRRKSLILSEISSCLSSKYNTPINIFFDALIHKVDEVSRLKLNEKSKLELIECFNLYELVELLPNDAWQYPRALSILIECLIKFDLFNENEDLIKNCLQIAFLKLNKLIVLPNKEKYEKIQLYSALFLAAGRCNALNEITKLTDGGESAVSHALNDVKKIDDMFYRGRAAGVLYALLVLIGLKNKIVSNSYDHMFDLLSYMDSEYDNNLNRKSDGVHSNADYLLFPILLVLNSISLIGCDRYLNFKRNWLNEAKSLFESLSVESKASQMLFYIITMNNLSEKTNKRIDVEALFKNVQKEYIALSYKCRSSEYLRCSYLVYSSLAINCKGVLDDYAFDILKDNIDEIGVPKVIDNAHYDSCYMKAAYIMSSFDSFDSLVDAFKIKYKFLDAIKNISEDLVVVEENAYKLYMAMVDMMLKQYPCKI